MARERQSMSAVAAFETCRIPLRPRPVRGGGLLWSSRPQSNLGDDRHESEVLDGDTYQVDLPQVMLSRGVHPLGRSVSRETITILYRP